MTSTGRSHPIHVSYTPPCVCVYSRTCVLAVILREHSDDRLVQARVVEHDETEVCRGAEDDSPNKRNRRCDEEGWVLPVHPPLSPPYLEDLKEAAELFGNTRTLRFFLRMFRMVRTTPYTP